MTESAYARLSDPTLAPDTEEIAKLKDKFHEQGFVLIKDFLKQEDIDLVHQRLCEIVNEWDPATSTSIFSTKSHAQASDAYFRASGPTVSIFLEDDAPGKLRALVGDDQDAARTLSPEVKLSLCNKIAHGMHSSDPAFASFILGPRLASVAAALGIPPLDIVQSMIICKPPAIGGAVAPHQDHSFVYTTDSRTVGEARDSVCRAFWMALDDASVANGCLWVVPGSHKSPPSRYWRYDKESDGLTFVAADKDGGVTAPSPAPPAAGGCATAGAMAAMAGAMSGMGARPAPTTDAAASSRMASVASGAIAGPVDELPPVPPCDDSAWVPVEVAKGTLLVFDGLLYHKSFPNTSASRRNAMTFHAIKRTDTLHPNSWMGAFGYARTPLGGGTASA